MKRIVVCLDGTWNAADSGKAETNVARIARAVRARPPGKAPQTVLYLRGVGSSGGFFQRLTDGAIGSGVDDNIRSAYMFIAQNYAPADDDSPADEIYLFGFSRGAYTARSLGGLIRWAGLLKRQHLDKVDQAWNYYRSEERKMGALAFAKRFDAAHPENVSHTDVSIEFMGVWDTVGALGIPKLSLFGGSQEKYQFHDTTPSAIVKRACHAMAVDEFRDEFVPTYWTGATPEGAEITQMWFAGAHSDVGGGYDDGVLAHIPLRWMAEEAAKRGLELDWTVLPPQDMLNDCADQHESREGWSLKDLNSPTFRKVCDYTFEVAGQERLRGPEDAAGNPVNAIGEELHPTLKARIGKDIQIRWQKAKGGSFKRAYEPRNIKR
ncbi:hypothetical protein GCM10007301_38540 [Azorhizobium oxalatiphilum]|uniref:T6SS Phospholipase effector Tle1-like catalytic domain-containing protein n=1 Tax=Azorhizobium oxalatiphilum TaxID=980631 RepID=A0A917FE75_9HYPH|nr:DUF2235 domain-containing protein [Azorhizobium oxalatiphilum]GGF74979.1 hypothetical protein GCM10007301_38540 [Azorhizobium oxalatiphilum]